MNFIFGEALVLRGQGVGKHLPNQKICFIIHDYPWKLFPCLVVSQIGNKGQLTKSL